jgi:hypothetical protein
MVTYRHQDAGVVQLCANVSQRDSLTCVRSNTHTQQSLVHVYCKLMEVFFACACALKQEQGLDTVDANRALGLPDDCREYTSVRNILRDLAVRSVQLMVRGARAQQQAAGRQRLVHVEALMQQQWHKQHGCGIDVRLLLGCL